MDKRSWLWKKKSAATASDSLAAASESDAAIAEKAKNEASKKPKYVQIPVESYSHLTGLENLVKSYEEQVQSLEDEVNELNEKLSKADKEIANKETLVKQHAKVAEEAVSGWEKVEAEAAALKNHLESVTLLKLTAEDRASHLDGALKECMRQIRHLKEDHEQNLQDVILTNQQLFDKTKLDLESRIAVLDRDLTRSAAENVAISRSLQEHSDMLVQLSEQKSRAEAEIKTLKSHIESWEKEAGSLKYELHIARKEVEIRNEEKNMSQRSAEVANRQHIEGAKKIAKLEDECQRLRGLVRKKLPGPAALAQMKLEVQNGEPHLRRAHFPNFLHDGSKMYQKENELVAERLLAMEEETEMLKEVVAKRNRELQDSRSLYAQTATKLRNLEAQIQSSEQKIRGKRGKPSSFASMSEDGNDDSVSCCGPSEVSHLRKKKSVDNQLGLMDDFLEMEKLAYLSNEEFLDNISKSGPELLNNEAPAEVAISKNSKESPQLRSNPLVFAELQSKISRVLKSISSEKDEEKVAEKIRSIMQDMHEGLQLQTVFSGKTNDTKEVSFSGKTNDTKEVSLSKDVETISQELQTAIIQIYDFVTILGKESMATDRGLHEEVETFTAKYGEAIYSQLNPIDFILDISLVLNKVNELQHFDFLGFKDSEVEIGSSDCIDKVALPENKPDLNSLDERYSSNGRARFSDSGSDPDVPNDGNLVPISESTAAPWKCSLEEFENLKTDKDRLENELARCIENFENTKSRLVEMERDLGEVKLQLTLAENSNSLAETQLKCITESYKLLETRADELKNDVIALQGKIETLESELLEERSCHREAVKRCEDLQEQLERIHFWGADDNDDKTSQEKEIAAATEKLAECQETIFLLGKQLKTLRPPTETSTPPNNVRIENAEPSVQTEHPISGMEILQENELSKADTFYLRRGGLESPMHPFNSTYTPPDSEADNFLRSPVTLKYSKHRPTKSGSSYASSMPTPERNGRGFSRFFSTKGKN